MASAIHDDYALNAADLPRVVEAKRNLLQGTGCLEAITVNVAVDEIGGEYSAGTFRVPAVRHFPDRPVRNSIRLPREGLGELLWREVREVYPAGLAQIDMESVISAHPVKHYSVLPDRAGLAELVDTGVLTIAGTSRGVRIRPARSNSSTCTGREISAPISKPTTDCPR